MHRLFGTDGVRGLANSEMTPEVATRLARAAVARIPKQTERPRFLVAKDTRLSADLLEAAVVAGLCSGGADALHGGVMPTPAAAQAVKKFDLQGGIVVSASHNAYEYNGLKFLGPGGHKLSEQAERDIEETVDADGCCVSSPCVGRVSDATSFLDDYLASLAGAVETRLNGLRIVLDCGHGALSGLAPGVVSTLGADVVAMNCRPTGRNINEGGAVKPQRLAHMVIDQRAQAGLAFDGDGDRLVMVDERGALIDGDQILAIWAADLASRNELTGNVVVGTLLTNGGLETFLDTMGCQLLRTPVGDRHVAEEMRRSGAVLGGETCGHIVFAPHLYSSDALHTGLAVLRLMKRTNKSLSELAGVIRKRPQVSRDIPVARPNDAASHPSVCAAVDRAQESLDGAGWLVVRPSGTEPVVRVTVECDDEDRAQRVAEEITCVLQDCIRDGNAVDVSRSA
ncbi:MAG: phosphoglucosamine mutase [Armatimonadetes bacterium]|nr:phosphoglucosamine mutase [Armatimonadota bacterium]